GGAVDGRDDGLERGLRDVRVQSGPPDDTVLDGEVDIGGRRGVSARADGVLGVVLEADVDVDVLDADLHERIDRTVAVAFVAAFLAVHDAGDLDAFGRTALRRSGVRAQPHDLEPPPGLVGVIAGQVLVVEDAADLLGVDLAAALGVLLDGAGEFALHATRQLEAVLALEQ